jgi:hypothetical protein
MSVVTGNMVQLAGLVLNEMAQSRLLTAATVEELRDQVTEMPAQRSLDEEALQLAHRPMVYPVAPLPLGPVPPDTPVSLSGERAIDVSLANAGGGLATELCAVLMGPTDRMGHAPRFALWKAVPLHPGDPPQAMTMEGNGGSWVRGTDTVAGRQLGPPPSAQDITQRDTPHVLARLTLTYRDIFGDTHATMVDFTAMARWENMAFFPKVRQGLEALNTAARTPADNQQPPTPPPTAPSSPSTSPDASQAP